MQTLNRSQWSNWAYPFVCFSIPFNSTVTIFLLGVSLLCFFSALFMCIVRHVPYINSSFQAFEAHVQCVDDGFDPNKNEITTKRKLLQYIYIWFSRSIHFNWMELNWIDCYVSFFILSRSTLTMCITHNTFAFLTQIYTLSLSFHIILYIKSLWICLCIFMSFEINICECNRNYSRAETTNNGIGSRNVHIVWQWCIVHIQRSLIHSALPLHTFFSLNMSLESI